MLYSWTSSFCWRCWTIFTSDNHQFLEKRPWSPSGGVRSNLASIWRWEFAGIFADRLDPVPIVWLPLQDGMGQPVKIRPHFMSQSLVVNNSTSAVCVISNKSCCLQCACALVVTLFHRELWCLFTSSLLTSHSLSLPIFWESPVLSNWCHWVYVKSSIFVCRLFTTIYVQTATYNFYSNEKTKRLNI